eukprot:g2329.t1
MAEMQSSILAGVRIVDWTTMAAGPGATAMLSELGANVDKIEAPQGDPWRSVGVERERGVSCVFEFDNRGKRSVVLDLSTAAGQLALKMLLRRADVLVTNVRPESARRLGLDYASLERCYPKLIYAHLTAWGRSGPMCDAPGYDAGAFYAATGMLDLMRPDDTDAAAFPRLPGAAGDHATSLALVAAVALALFSRQCTGRGRLVDVSLLRTGLWCNGMMLSAAAASRAQAQAWRDPERHGPTFGPMRCADGAHLYLLGYQTRRHLAPLLRALGLTFQTALDLGSDDEVKLRVSRDDNNAGSGKAKVSTTRTIGELSVARLRILRRAVARRMLSRRAEEWERIFDDEGVWYTRVMRFDEPGDVLALDGNNALDTEHGGRGLMSRVSAQCNAAGAWVKVPGLKHPLVAQPLGIGPLSRTSADDEGRPETQIDGPASGGMGGQIECEGRAAQVSSLPQVPKLVPPKARPRAPRLGEHTRSSLIEAGCSHAEYERLNAQGAFGKIRGRSRL